MANFRVERWSEFSAPSPAVLRMRLAGEGYSIHHWVGGTGIIHGVRKIELEECHWVISGELEITFATGERYTLKTGDRDFIPAKSWYKARAAGEEPLNYLVGVKIKRKRGRPKKL
jgi:mannose-6-phosphate isomerase-like protein (cupin superfamily)